MTTHTENFNLPVPEGDESPDGPGQIGALAEAVDGNLSKGIRSSGAMPISAEQSRSSTTFGALGTPDRVSNVVVGQDGLLFVMYRALVKATTTPGAVAAYAAASLFLSGTELKTTKPGSAPDTFIQVGNENVIAAAQHTTYGTMTTTGGIGAKEAASSPHAQGSMFGAPKGGGGNESFVTTGTVHRSVSGLGLGSAEALQLWSPVVIEVNPGTYTVEVRFKTYDATVYLKERKLWVWSMGFGLPVA